MTARAFGGYFGLETGRGRALPWLAGAVRYQSARSALVAAVGHRAVARVLVPHFVCGAVVDAIAYLGIPTAGYALETGRRVPATLDLGRAELLLFVDYFGMSGEACDEAIARFGADRVLVDASQALFHRPREGVATVFSPRKFAGLPDGGLLLNAAGEPPLLPAQEMASVARSQHLLLRAAGMLEAGYGEFQAAESSLADCRPLAMSQLTCHLLDGIDFDDIGRQRRANYATLAKALVTGGYVVEGLADDAVPLCCPVSGVDAPRLRATLAANRIFTPGYWPDASIPPEDVVGLALRDRTLYLPCDQRYDEHDMNLIARHFIDLETSA